MYDQPLTQDPDQNEIQQEQIRRGVFRAQTKKFRWTRLWGGKLVLIEDFYCFLLISDHCWCCISQWFLRTHGKWKLCWIMLSSGNYAKLCYMMLARLQSVNYAFYAKASVAQPKMRSEWFVSSDRWVATAGAARHSLASDYHEVLCCSKSAAQGLLRASGQSSV